MISEYNKEIIIEDKKLNQMKLNILKAEQNNLKTREKTNDEMIESIRKIIIDEEKKNY
ncbi:hypothetical protein [Fictibacillus halophilus]|uniref:hypothetical protein n=1 Tax=Fictibacillus halophilus TaxID=1610490 RepID=UPI001CFBB613|nr:hypothetical protein [Fictibacillus halophilus]